MPPFTTYATGLRNRVGDNPQTTAARVYTDVQLADFTVTGTEEHLLEAYSGFAWSGSGPNMTISPTPSDQELPLLYLYWTRSVLKFEVNNVKRVGFSVSNLAGRVDGRERYTTAREGVRDVNVEIRAELKRQSKRSGYGNVIYRDAGRPQSGSAAASELGYR